MAIEIEKKFLVTNDDWRKLATENALQIQGYFSTSESCSIRIRISENEAHLNIKSATLGITRSEYDYPVPLEDAKEMLQSLCIKPLIEKVRYFVPVDNHVWEIDVFSGENEGLVVAEIELTSVNQAIHLPPWIGREVSDDPRYYNVCLVKNPYCNWKDQE